MLRYFNKYCTMSLQGVMQSLFMVCLGASTSVGATDLSFSSGLSYQVGTDIWQLNPSAEKDSRPNYIEENSNLLLPNSHTKLTYNDISFWGRLIANKQLTKDISISTKIRADQTVGIRVDEAQIEKELSPFLMLRAGVVDYKTSWCRTYEPTNGWLQEVEAICNTPEFRDVTGGAPGIQIVTRQTWADSYALQTQLGLYQPLFMNYAPNEFGNLIPSPNFEVKKNNKLGVNFNLLNLQNGAEIRMSYIRSEQSAYLPEVDLNGHQKLSSDLFYAGLNLPVNEKISFRLTHLKQLQNGVCRSSVAKIGSACNLNLSSDKNSTALEIAYRWGDIGYISTGISQTNFDTYQEFFTPALDVFSVASPFTIKSEQASIAWRKDWGKGVFTIAQFIQSKQKSSSLGVNFNSDGSALGLRIGYLY